MNKQQFDVVVIGGGASGMIAAYSAAQKGKRVCILEKNTRLGEKLRITGGGRCNITNAEFDTRTLLKNYAEAEQFLFSAFSQFGVQDTITFFESRGLPLIVEARKRVFPKTERAEDVYKLLEKSLQDAGVYIHTKEPVTRMSVENQNIVSVETNKSVYTAKSFILATGGVSHPETGSTGDGFIWLTELNLEVKQPTPTIVPLTTSEDWIHNLAGMTLPDVKVTFYVEGIKQFSVNGPVLCTHFGLSGPTILNATNKVLDLLHSGMVTAYIDLYPKKDEGSLDEWLLEIFEQHKNKLLKNIVNEFLPLGTGVSILEGLKIEGDLKVHSISKEVRKKLVKGIKSLPVTITGHLGFDKAVIADGGISLEEIDTRTMRVKKYENLFVTGDLLHIRRPSGGFSLQLCWTTGFVAGSHA